ncbi:universal stress protein [Sphaerospermopsis aphanizomenoides BCCUSP55]|uniref:universal stress protein n=1 Tax=Sphaerospermopsis aphanizomenoides TaxID=459663 RepID=UPI0019036261|nr:universal stress protein [Sphaerospermopsis aphanizomenoides]MBK1987737.1 universal stress protein [Sphaerospermopsis aphanizomenoides BCCUSP55]
MFNNILVALDRSEMNQSVFDQALSLAKLTSANLMLLHVLSPEEDTIPDVMILPNTDYYPGWGDESMKLYLKKLEIHKNEGLQMLQKFSAQANNANIDTQFIQKVGSPGSVICNLAREWNADLIMMGRRGLSGITEFLIGSVSNYVLHHAPCSVHIIHLPVKVKAD